MSSEKERKPFYHYLILILYGFALAITLVLFVIEEIEDYKKIHELCYCCACYGELPEKFFIVECECDCHNSCCKGCEN